MATDWKNEWQKHTDNPPKEGSILKAYGDEMAKLTVELVDGKEPFVYGRAYVPAIVGHPLGWFLQPIDGANFGWKCILMPKSRDEALRKLGMKDAIPVKSLRVIRRSKSGSSLLVEVAEY